MVANLAGASAHVEHVTSKEQSISEPRTNRDLDAASAEQVLKLIGDAVGVIYRRHFRFGASP